MAEVKINELGRAVSLNKDVSRLEITVYYVALVSVGKGLANLAEQFQALSERELVPVYILRQANAIN